MSWLSKLKFTAIDKSPELWFVGGCIMLVGAVVSAGRSRCKFEAAKERKEERLEAQKAYIKESMASGNVYTVKEQKKDRQKVMFDFVVETAIGYLPTVALTVGSAIAFGKAFGILKTWYAGMASAYAGLAKQSMVTANDEEDKPFDITQCDRLFGPSNPNYTGDVKKDMWFLEKKEEQCQDRLERNKALFLNEIYEILEMQQSQAGQVMGKLCYDDDGSVNRVSFGLDRPDCVTEDGILLRFNIDRYPILGRSGLVMV